MRSLFTPLLPDDYLELINPLWSTQELRGRIERIERETEDAATVFIKPGWEWPGHEPGQYLRIGFVVDGVHHWRAYSLTSDPGRPDGLISITPKLVEEGTVTPWLVREAQPGTIVRLSDVEGTFKLPDPPPDKLLPHDGIYATWVTLGGKRYRAASSLGVRPTFGGGPRKLEAYILDFNEDVYGQEATIAFEERLRDELRFDSAEDLAKQIAKDVQQTRLALR